MHSELRTNLEAIRAEQASLRKIGFVETQMPRVRLFWADTSVARAPLSYEPGIAVIVSGQKIGYFEDRRIVYGPGQYLAVGLPVFFECETMASKETPLIGIFLSMDPLELRTLARELATHDPATLSPQTGLGIEPLTMPEPFRDAVTRLTRHVLNAAEAAVLGPDTVKEIFFHALQDRHGRVLLSQTHGNRPEARIAQVLRDLEKTPETIADVESLADAAGMSTASLHRHFKAVTGLSPLQYQKRKRLMQAKSLLTFGNLGVAETARAVGYASAAQFSRDFSAYFGTPPSRADHYPYPA